MTTMKTETSRSGKGSAATMPIPANFDEMTVAEFLDYVRWWATLPSTDRQSFLKNERRH
jgi:hypothetical protein